MNWDTKNYCILLVEDNKLNQTVVKFTLKRYGYSIEIANNGVEAVEKFKNKKYDFILMDIMMPEMDGMEATHVIRKLEKEKHTPIIALTADTILTDEKKCIENGMNGYIAKPFNIENLFEILEKLGL